MTVLQDIYFVTSCLGFLYIVGSAILGSFHSGGSSGHGGGHAGHSSHGGHLGHAGHAHGSSAGVHGHSGPVANGSHGAHGSAGRISSPGNAGHSNHSGRIGPTSAATHGNAGHSSHPPSHAGSGGGAHDTAHGGNHTSTNNGDGAVHDGGEMPNTLSMSKSSINVRRSQIPTFFLIMLDILSPTKLAFFAFMFGVIGFISGKFIPGYMSLAPAIILGWISASLFFDLLGRIFSRLNSSTNFKKESLIGSIGELSLSIENGGLGEMVVRTGNSRYNYAVRPASPQQTIKKLARVIIVDLKEGIFVVEPFEDENV